MSKNVVDQVILAGIIVGYAAVMNWLYAKLWLYLERQKAKKKRECYDSTKNI